MLVYPISFCLILLGLHPLYIPRFHLLNFHCFPLTFRSLWCHNYGLPLCSRASQQPWQAKSPTQCTVCVVTRQAVRVSVWTFQWTCVVGNVCFEGERPLQTQSFCVWSFVFFRELHFNFQESLFIMSISVELSLVTVVRELSVCHLVCHNQLSWMTVAVLQNCQDQPSKASCVPWVCYLFSFSYVHASYLIWHVMIKSICFIEFVTDAATAKVTFLGYYWD